MTKEELCKLAGSQSELARILGITRASVHQWTHVPKGRLYDLLKLRPEWFKNQKK